MSRNIGAGARSETRASAASAAVEAITVHQKSQTSSHGALKVTNIKSPIQQFEQGLLEQKHLAQEQKARQELQRHQQRLKQLRCVEGLVPEVSPMSILAHGIAVVAALVPDVTRAFSSGTVSPLGHKSNFFSAAFKASVFLDSAACFRCSTAT